MPKRVCTFEDDLKNEREILKVLTKYGMTLQYFPKYQNEPVFVWAALSNNQNAFIFASQKIQLELLKNHSNALIELIDDYNVFFTILKSNGLALQYASERIRDSMRHVFIAIKNTPDAFKFASKRLQYNILLQNPKILKIASDDVKNDELIVSELVQINGLVLEYASEQLKSNKEIIGHAVRQNKYSWFFVSESIIKEVASYEK